MTIADAVVPHHPWSRTYKRAKRRLREVDRKIADFKKAARSRR